MASLWKTPLSRFDLKNVVSQQKTKVNSTNYWSSPYLIIKVEYDDFLIISLFLRWMHQLLEASSRRARSSGTGSWATTQKASAGDDLARSGADPAYYTAELAYGCRTSLWGKTVGAYLLFFHLITIVRFESLWSLKVRSLPRSFCIYTTSLFILRRNLNTGKIPVKALKFFLNLPFT